MTFETVTSIDLKLTAIHFMLNSTFEYCCSYLFKKFLGDNARLWRQRQVMAFHCNIKKSAARNFLEAYDENAPSKTICEVWLRRFGRGDCSVIDKVLHNKSGMMTHIANIVRLCKATSRIINCLSSSNWPMFEIHRKDLHKEGRDWNQET